MFWPDGASYQGVKVEMRCRTVEESAPGVQRQALSVQVRVSVATRHSSQLSATEHSAQNMSSQASAHVAGKASTYNVLAPTLRGRQHMLEVHVLIAGIGQQAR